MFKILFIALTFLTFSISPRVQSDTSDKSDKDAIQKWCTDVSPSIKKYKWNLDPCAPGLNWKVGGHSVQGRPLIYAEFGDPQSKNTTLILALVHGDEITPLYLGLALSDWLRVHTQEISKDHVIVAPMVNPDGYYLTPRTRMNSRGVDVNRNFDTHDWQTNAWKAWKVKFKSDPRRFPGPSALSEPETVFQKDLIAKFKPQKILSVHSPLNHLDYDGPNHLSLSRFSKDYVVQCLTLRNRLKAVSTGFFPGSLGNYAGQELGIPTVTLELPSADYRRAKQYWLTFSRGITTMIDYQLPH